MLTPRTQHTDHPCQTLLAPVALALLLAIAAAGCQSSHDRLFNADNHRIADNKADTTEDAAKPPPWGRRSWRAAERETEEIPELDENATIEDWIDFALANNPNIEAAYHRWKAAEQRGPQARALPDPRLGYTYFIQSPQTRVGPVEHQFTLSQSFPWFGTRSARGEVADTAARVDEARFEATGIELAGMIRQRAVELAYLNQSIRIKQETLDLTQRVESIARSRYRVGTQTHPDLVRVQIELLNLEIALERLKDQRRPLVATINSLLNRPTDAPLPNPDIALNQTIDATTQQLATQLRASNPSLRALEREIEQNRAATDLARKAFYPNFDLGLMYALVGEARDPTMPDSGDDQFAVMGSISLPIWRDSYRAGVAESLATRAGTAGRRAAEENELLEQLESALFEHRDALRRAELYRSSLIPKAENAFSSLLAAFSAGDATMLDVLESERQLLEFRLAEQRARADATIALAALDTLIGRQVPRKPIETDNTADTTTTGDDR